MAVRAEGPAPYAPAATVLSLIAAFRSRGLQTPFNQDVLLRAGVPDSLVPRTLQALKLLDLIDPDGNPTTQLEGLRRAPEAEYKQRLEAVIRAAYAEVFQYVDPAKDGTVKVRDAFRAFEPIGQLGRMVTLFLGLCEAAGIIPENPKKQSGASPAARPRPSNARPKAPGSTRPPSVGANLRAQEGLVPAAITGLLQSLPGNGKGWSQDQRDRFLKTFEAVLDFCVPIRDVEAEENEAE
jgi:hypothetical protein